VGGYGHPSAGLRRPSTVSAWRGERGPQHSASKHHTLGVHVGKGPTTDGGSANSCQCDGRAAPRVPHPRAQWQLAVGSRDVGQGPTNAAARARPAGSNRNAGIVCGAFHSQRGLEGILSAVTSCGQACTMFLELVMPSRPPRVRGWEKMGSDWPPQDPAWVRGARAPRARVGWSNIARGQGCGPG